MSQSGVFETCMLPRPQKGISVAHTAIVMIVHSTLIGLVFFKHLLGFRFGRTPLLSFLMRDAASYYVTVFLLCGIALTICGLDDQRAIVVFYWSISVFSSIGCHLILNMECFARRYSSDEVIQFTSHITVQRCISTICGRQWKRLI
ncbi:hypothetical protein OG21DRAFT_1506171 [Imleria badia]|nr:hypothetical protein OG21DRAFT_1506171 [Imleria badia]